MELSQYFNLPSVEHIGVGGLLEVLQILIVVAWERVVAADHDDAPGTWFRGGRTATRLTYCEATPTSVLRHVALPIATRSRILTQDRT